MSCHLSGRAIQKTLRKKDLPPLRGCWASLEGENLKNRSIEEQRVVLCTALCFVPVPASRIRWGNSPLKVDSECRTLNKKCWKHTYQKQQIKSRHLCRCVFLNMKNGGSCAGKWLHPEVTEIVCPYVDVCLEYFCAIGCSTIGVPELAWSELIQYWICWALDCMTNSKTSSRTVSVACSLEPSKEGSAQFTSLSANGGWGNS